MLPASLIVSRAKNRADKCERRLELYSTIESPRRCVVAKAMKCKDSRESGCCGGKACRGRSAQRWLLVSHIAPRSRSRTSSLVWGSTGWLTGTGVKAVIGVTRFSCDCATVGFGRCLVFCQAGQDGDGGEFLGRSAGGADGFDELGREVRRAI